MSAAPVFRTRIVPAAAAVAVIGALAAGGWSGWRELAAQPIAHVAFSGDATKIAPADLTAFAASLRRMPAGSVSLAAVRDSARRIPWVRDASVRRRFPDGLDVRFETYDALARWGKAALVSTHGEVFAAPFEGKLPRFAGPDGSAAHGAGRRRWSVPARMATRPVPGARMDGPDRRGARGAPRRLDPSDAIDAGTRPLDVRPGLRVARPAAAGDLRL